MRVSRLLLLTLGTCAQSFHVGPRVAGSARDGLALHSHRSTEGQMNVDRRSLLSTVSTFMGMGLLVGALPKPTLAAPVEAEDIRQILITYDGKPRRVGDVLGPKGTIVVNVASQCALTGGSYSGLVDVYDRYRDQGLEILAFPSNEFGGQEPDPVPKIRKDIGARFGVRFPIFDKINVNGKGMHPLFAALKSYEPELSGYGQKTAWNFEKWLLGPDGKPLRRYKPGVDPLDMEADIQSVLSKGVVGPQRKRSLNDF